MTFTFTPAELSEAVQLLVNLKLNPSQEEILIQIQALLDAVNRETTVDASILQLVNQVIGQNKDLATQLADAIAANDPVAMAAVQKALDDSVKVMTANADQISAAVTNNTPPPPPPPPAV